MPEIKFDALDYYQSLQENERGLAEDFADNHLQLEQAWQKARGARDERLRLFLIQSNSDICSRSDLHQSPDNGVRPAADFKLLYQRVIQGLNGSQTSTEYLYNLCSVHYPPEPNYKNKYSCGLAVDKRDGRFFAAEDDRCLDLEVTRFIPARVYQSLGLPDIKPPDNLELLINSFRRPPR